MAYETIIEEGIDILVVGAGLGGTGAAWVARFWGEKRPGTDAAMAEAIAYVWLTEETYDKDYISSRTIGFEEWKRRILGKEDGTPRTPG